MPNNTQSDIELIVSVVRKYYEMGMTQDQISSEEFISKSTVSRLLKKATENGIVQFQLNYPVDSIKDIKREFRKYFSFSNLHIAPTFTDNPETKLRDTCRLAANDICNMLEKDDILGIGWGLSMEQLTEILSTEIIIKVKCDKVVMIDGSIASDINSMQSTSIIKKLADFFSADGYLMPVPMIVDCKETADILKEDSHVRYVMDYARKARIAVFSIGYASHDSVLRKRGAYSKKEYDEALSNGAVGDILGHCFNIAGRSVSKETEERIIALSLDEVREKEHRIGIAVGPNKAKAIIGALRGNIVNHLYTDGDTAKEVIRIIRKTFN
ncbi:MAG: hypothetical protein LBJ91_02755 [Clostridiales Family XIII bacterium]|nr:hypothetical protein [Clostridiales Family XIII bacterium]